MYQGHTGVVYLSIFILKFLVSTPFSTLSYVLVPWLRVKCRDSNRKVEGGRFINTPLDDSGYDQGQGGWGAQPGFVLEFGGRIALSACPINSLSLYYYRVLNLERKKNNSVRSLYFNQDSPA